MNDAPTDDPTHAPTDPGGRRWHDMGGQPAPALDLAEHDHALWEKRVDALMVLCSARGLLTVDGLRRALEDMGPGAFETMSYYERWVAAVAQNLIEAGAVTQDALGRRIAEVQARGASYGEAASG